MMINSKYSLRPLTTTTLEDRHRLWREGRRQLRAHLGLAVELIKNYCNLTRNSSFITGGITNVREEVTVAAVARSLL